MAAHPPYRLHDSLLYQLTLTSRLQERRLEERLRPLGLTRITWCILLVVAHEGRERPSEIAEHIGICRTAMSRALRQMEAEGWLHRRSGRPDRRTTTVALTEAGQQKLDAAIPVARENGQHFLAKLGGGEPAHLARLLARLREGESRDLTQF
jgi:DNA-binding MarR family transcriptional regulator